MEVLVGRKEEKQILQDAIQSGEPELVAVYGRRRVGKTYLVRQVCAKWLFFEFSGVSNSTMKDQLEQFTLGLQKAMNSPAPLAIPANWSQALGLLMNYAGARPKNKKLLIFFNNYFVH